MYIMEDLAQKVVRFTVKPFGLFLCILLVWRDSFTGLACQKYVVLNALHKCFLHLVVDIFFQKRMLFHLMLALQTMVNSSIGIANLLENERSSCIVSR